MAGKLVDVEKILSVEPQSIIDALSSENSKLRVENMAQREVINKLVNAINEIQQNDGGASKPSGQRTSKKSVDLESEDF